MEHDAPIHRRLAAGDALCRPYYDGPYLLVPLWPAEAVLVQGLWTEKMGQEHAGAGIL